MSSDKTIRKVASVVQHTLDGATVYDDAGEPMSAAETVARALDSAGLLAPDMREEWAARYVNGGSAICRTRDEAEAELDRMTRDSHRHRVDEPPAPEIAGIYIRYVTDWETP